jgi:hypothetical protein
MLWALIVNEKNRRTMEFVKSPENNENVLI